MIDTHSHIDMLQNTDEAVKKSISAGVEKIVVPTSSPENFDDVISLCSKYDEIFGAVGVHPEDISKYGENTAKEIYNIAKNNKKIVAIGEIGLDYYWDKTQKEEQKKIFRAQIEIALNLNLPVLVHSREAHLDTFEILKETGIKKVIMHCFSSSLEFANSCIKEGWLLGIGGVVTFKNSRKLKEVVKNIPLESIVLETDAPYMAPHPMRGMENTPEYLPFIAREIALLKDITVEHVDKVTTKTAKEFFNI